MQMWLNLDRSLEIHRSNEHFCTSRPPVIQARLPMPRILFRRLFFARKMSSVANSVCVYVTRGRNVGVFFFSPLCINRGTAAANGGQKADNLQGVLHLKHGEYEWDGFRGIKFIVMTLWRKPRAQKEKKNKNNPHRPNRLCGSVSEKLPQTDRRSQEQKEMPHIHYLIDR